MDGAKRSLPGSRTGLLEKTRLRERFEKSNNFVLLTIELKLLHRLSTFEMLECS